MSGPRRPWHLGSGLRIEVEQRLDLLAQCLHPLEMAQYAQRDEVWHVQNAPYAEALAYPRQGALLQHPRRTPLGGPRTAGPR